MTKVVYNGCYGGFSLSDAGVKRYAEIKGVKLYPEIELRSGGLTTFWTVPPEEREGKILEGDAWYRATTEERIASNKYYTEHTIYSRTLKRDDPALVQVVEEMGDKANGMCAKLIVEDIPVGTKYRITEYDGYEGIETSDEVDWQVAS